MDTIMLDNLLLYIAELSRDDPKFGAVKLNKLLFFLDVEFCAEFERGATGFQFKKLGQGPVAHNLDLHCSAMEKNGLAEIQYVAAGGNTAHRLVPKAKPDMSKIPLDVQRIAREIVERYRPYTAKALSDLTHSMICWKNAADLEVIPLDAAFLDVEPATAQERAYALQLV